MANQYPFETFAPLTVLRGIRHAFTLRTAGNTKSEDFQPELLRSLGYTAYAAAEQTHGDQVALVRPPFPSPVSCTGEGQGEGPWLYPGVDALITNTPGLPLVIRCADCAPVFIVDPGTRTIALIHSGKKGTALNITGNTIATLKENFGTNPGTCRALIGPCIGPCHYEINLWQEIETQLRATGITDIHNPRLCTACNLTRYYSYRVEKGQTGRMYALLALV